MKNIIICDIDGTIADCEHRIHLLKKGPVNWNDFYKDCDKDTPIEPICELLKFLYLKYTIVFMTGRTELVRSQTLAWIGKHFPATFTDCLLLMRDDGDKRHDTKAKPEMAYGAGLLPEMVAFILEDRNSMVDKWRGMGYTCLQVAEGDF